MNEPVLRLPIYIPRNLHSEFKSRCSKHGKQMQEIAETMVRSWLAMPEKKAFPKK